MKKVDQRIELIGFFRIYYFTQQVKKSMEKEPRILYNEFAETKHKRRFFHGNYKRNDIEKQWENEDKF